MGGFLAVGGAVPAEQDGHAGCISQAPGRAQNRRSVASHTSRGAFLMGEDRQKCFCVTFGESNKAYPASNFTPFVFSSDRGRRNKAQHRTDKKKEQIILLP